jgi:V/A-type H+-transporting ATPase subunit C
MPVKIKAGADYGYINARIRAMKSRLLSESFIEQLLTMPDVSEVVAALARTEYKEDIEKGTVKQAGILGVEEGLKDHLVNIYRKILDMVAGNREAERLVKILLGRWDLHNLRTILRGKHIEAPIEEVEEQLIPAGDLDKAVLSELVKQPTVKAFIDLMVLWDIPYGRPLSEAYTAYAENKRLADLELVLDKFYYHYALQEAHGRSLNTSLVRELLRREIDFLNITTLLRLVREHIEVERPSEYFIEGGRELSIERLVELLTKPEIEDVVASLQDYSYHSVLEEALKKYFVTGAVSVIQRRMEELIIRKTVSLFRGDPLSIALIAAYIWAKYNEMVNLRIIVRGKAAGMREETIREALVLV